MERKGRVYHKYLVENKIVPWKSFKTTKEMMRKYGFPGHALNEKKTEWCFDLDEIEAWFKEREEKLVLKKIS